MVAEKLDVIFDEINKTPGYSLTVMGTRQLMPSLHNWSITCPNNKTVCPRHTENFRNQRKRVAAKVGNPRLLQIKFTSFRHWKGTMEYHITKDLLHVKTLLGHKCVKNTEIYVNIDQQLFSGFSDEFTTKVATTVEEDCKLLEAGFEYVTERQGNKIYRKRK